MNQTIDTAVIVIFSAFVLGIGMLFARTGRNLKSFFAGGEAVPWFIGGLSLFMSFFSAGTFVAWGSIAYKHGWVAITIQWTMCIGAIVTGLYLAPRWKATGALTAAEFIRERLGLTVQKVYIFIFTLVSVFIKGSVLYPVAKLVSTSLNLPLVPTTVGLGIFMIAYTAVGGLWAVMVTDILQFVVLSAAVFILLPLSLDRVGGMDGFMRNVPADFFSPLAGDYTLGFVLAFVFYHIAYIGGNWTFVQRYTSVDSPKSARKVAFLFAGMYLVAPVIWMLPPMIYRVIDPSLAGLDTENAYLKICQLVLPPGLLGLMLTGMYFSTSASANTALNVVSAVFTNDIYKGILNPQATDKQLIRVARGSSWVFGLGMIVIALLVPAAGGMVEVVLSISAISGGPLLAPPLWALFSKRLTSRATLWVTIIGLSVNLFAKILLPLLFAVKLSRAWETAIGMGVPLLLLLAFELYQRRRNAIATDYYRYKIARQKKLDDKADSTTPEETEAIAEQNRFGLKVIAASLVFTALMLFALGTLAESGGRITAGIGVVVLLGAYIPWRASRRKPNVPASASVAALLLLLGCGVGTSANAQTTSLNGMWAFRTDPTDAGTQQGWFATNANWANSDSLNVPGNWDLRNEYAHYVGKGWYRHTFPTPSNTNGKVIRLRFEAVYHNCTVWLNGQKLGRAAFGENHMGYFPFEFDLTDKLNPTGPNVLVVCTDNTFRRGAIWSWGGIRRPVSLVVSEPVRVVRQHITPTVNLATKSASVAVRVFLQNHQLQAAQATGTVQFTAPNGLNRSLPFQASVPASSTASVLVQTALTPAETHLWHFDDPYLYTSTVRFAGTDVPVANRFGIRKIEVDHKAYTLKLNGEVIRPMGFNLVPDDRTTGNTLPTWRIKEDVDMLKKLGCNMARLTHLPLPAEFLDYLDERGVLVFNEIPLWGFDRMADPAAPEPPAWLNQLITNDYNHACIIGWGVGNEIGYYPTVMDYVAAATRLARSLDSTRLAVMVSHSAHQTPDPLQFSDLGLINKYGKDLGNLTTVQHQAHPNKTLFYSEFGIGQIGEDLDMDYNAKASLDSIRFRPYLIGASYWTFNDYRSDYYGTRDKSENRSWGVVDVARQPKRAFESFRREQAPVRRLAVATPGPTGATVTLTPRQPLDLPAFTLRGYRLVWERHRADGSLLDGGFADVPTLAPGAPDWQRILSWTPNAEAHALRVTLLSPLGYAALDTTVHWQKPNVPVVVSARGARMHWGQIRANLGLIRLDLMPNPTATTDHKARYRRVGEATYLETPPTRNAFIDVPKLPFNTSYEVSVVATNGAGETVTPPQTVLVTYDYVPPIIRFDEPTDEGFFVGYATNEDDYFFRLQYSENPTDWTAARSVQTTNPGVMQVRGLQNGKRYYYRLQRMSDAYTLSEWSAVRSIVPDGGQRPAAPTVRGVIRQGGEAIVSFVPVKKATGYLLQYQPTSAVDQWKDVPVAAARIEHIHLAGLSPTQSYRFRLATLNANRYAGGTAIRAGQSDFSTTQTIQPDAKSRRNR